MINQGLSSDILDLILIPVRHKLFWIPVYVFILSFVIMNYADRRWMILAGILLCIIISDQTSSNLIKNSVKRQRPCHVEHLNSLEKVPCSHGYSFTSSHATNHFAISAFLFLLFGAWKFRMIFFLWAALIAFAQVYVGVHYPLDVLAGSVLGILIGVLSFKFYEFITKKYKIDGT